MRDCERLVESCHVMTSFGLISVEYGLACCWDKVLSVLCHNVGRPVTHKLNGSKLSCMLILSLQVEGI